MKISKREGVRCTDCPRRVYVPGTGGLLFDEPPPNSVLAIEAADGTMQAYCFAHAVMRVGARRVREALGGTETTR